jgi:hypothetical protein
MSDKREILAQMTFGKRIAEEEGDELEAYFVETDQWRKILTGEIDVVYGAKGSGKSAIYSLLQKRKPELNERGIVIIAGENVRGTPVFKDLIADPPASEEQFRNLWKVYLLSLIGSTIARVDMQGPHARRVVEALEGAKLIERGLSLRGILRSALDYVRRLELEGTLNFDPSGNPEAVGGKITLREPSSAEREKGYVSADSLLDEANLALADFPTKFWIVLDRLDVAFAESEALEANALRALFRVYLDLAGLEHISIKIFLRDDIWKRITATGFREASHITKYIRLTWDSQSLLNLIIRRALHNPHLREFYGVDSKDVLADTRKQEKLFYRIFPKQVDAGARKSTTLDWMLTRTADTTKQTAPRELIHLLSSARDTQLKMLELGVPGPPEEALFDRTSLKDAMPEVSKVRFEQTLCAEYPNLKPYLMKLEREKTQQTPETLARIWDVGLDKAIALAESLTKVGFFERRGTKDRPTFWVPFLYRDALDMIQGPAD